MGQHVTKQLLEALKQLVVDAATMAGSNVYVNRVTPLSARLLPAIVIAGGDELLEAGMQGLINRQPEIDLVVVVGEADGYDDQAYEILLELEHLVADNPTIGGKVGAIAPYAVEWTRAGEGDQAVIRAALRLRAELYVAGNAVDVHI